MAASTSSKKGKKKKGQTVNLSDFLSGGTASPQDGKAVVTLKATSWADTMEDDDDEYSTPSQQIALPTAPRAARQEIDLSQLPDKPPYTAYVGNLSYDVDEGILANFFSKMRVGQVRLVRDQGRMKGYGYVEFEDKQSLIEALGLSGETLMARNIRVDLATQNTNRDGGFGGDSGEGRRGGNQISGEGDADDDWRGSAAANKTSYEPSGYGRHRDNGYGGRDERDGGFRRGGHDDRDGGGYGAPRERYSEADASSSWGRGPPRSDSHSDRSGGYGSSRGYEPPRDNDGYGSRRGGYGGDRNSGYGRRDDSGYGGRRDGRYNDYNVAHHGGGSRYDDYQRGGGRGGHYNRQSDRNDERGGYDRQASSEAPKERPRLQLAPRTASKPSEATSTAAAPSVFGAAKPVDTAAREREIEDRLKRESESRPAPRDSRDSRDQGSSFGSRDIRTNVERRVYNGADDHTGTSNRENEQPVEKPAPEPVKKPSAASIFGAAKPVDTAAKEREIEERLRKEESRKDVGGERRIESSRDQRRDDSVRDAPKSNAWSRGAPQPSRPGADARRGVDRAPRHQGRKEKPLPKSIEDMPTYKESESKDFSDTNKYAGLLGSDGDDDEQD